MKSDNTQQVAQTDEFTALHKTASRTFKDSKDVALAHAVCLGDAAAIDRLIQEGANPNALSEDRSMSMLTWAMACESPGGMEALLRAKADPNVRLIRLNPNDEPYAENPVTLAADLRQPQYLQLLLRHGGDPNSRVTDGTALRTAFERGLSDGYQNYYLLLNAGADPALADGLVMELMYTFGKFDMVSELLERGYSYHLDRIAWFIQRSAEIDNYPQDGGPDRERQRASAAKVRTQLEQRGIHFPVSDEQPSRKDEIAREDARLTANAKKPGGLLLNP